MMLVLFVAYILYRTNSDPFVNAAMGKYDDSNFLLVSLLLALDLLKLY